MAKQDAQSKYQIRRVKRLDWGGKIVTHAVLAKATKARDKTLDFFAKSDEAALSKARQYCKYGSQKSELPEEFLGVVVAKHQTDPKKLVSVDLSMRVTKRSRRLTDTTVWIYYVNPSGEAYEVTKSRSMGALVQ